MMNLGFYHPSHNPYGCKRSSDDKYWYNTTVAFNTTADCFNPSKLLTDSGTISSGKSGRDDGRYGDAVYDGGIGGIVDYRLGAVANDSPEEAAKVEAKVENGTYRGLEKLVRTKVYGDSRFNHPANKISVFASEIIFYVDFASAAMIGEMIGGYNPSTGETVSGVITRAADNSFLGIDRKVANLPSGDFTPISVASGIDAYAILTTKTNLSVSGKFNTQMVIGDPANIPLTDALKDGWLGTWCNVIPEGTPKTFEFSRKDLEARYARTYTNDNGVTWAVAGRAGSWSSSANAMVNESIASDRVEIHSYTALAEVTKPSTNKPVLNASKGLLGVTVTQSHDKAVLAEAVAGIILKSNASGIVTEQSQAVKYLVDGTIKRLKTLPTDMVAPTNSSQAIKIAVYQISNNGQTSLAIIANTMTHNGTSWGELDEIQIPSGGSGSFTDTNGTTQQSICTELSMASGWTSNHARTGPQVAGVDL